MGEGEQVGGRESCVAGWKSPRKKGRERGREGGREGRGEVWERARRVWNGGNHLARKEREGGEGGVREGWGRQEREKERCS